MSPPPCDQTDSGEPNRQRRTKQTAENQTDSGEPNRQRRTKQTAETQTDRGEPNRQRRTKQTAENQTEWRTKQTVENQTDSGEPNRQRRTKQTVENQTDSGEGCSPSLVSNPHCLGPGSRVFVTLPHQCCVVKSFVSIKRQLSFYFTFYVDLTD